MPTNSTIDPRETLRSTQAPLVCPYCQTTFTPLEGVGTTLHYSRLSCACCGRFLRWRKWPRDQNGCKLPRPLSLAPTTK